MSDQPDAKLPEGKTCGDCAHFGRCQWLIQVKPESKECDWSPARFVPKPKGE